MSLGNHRNPSVDKRSRRKGCISDIYSRSRNYLDTRIIGQIVRLRLTLAQETNSLCYKDAHLFLGSTI